MLLIDHFKRRINYLRISITDHCNLHCIYCRQGEAPALPRTEILTYEEIFGIIQVAQDLGIEKFRLTGGEPLLRKGLMKFLEKLSLAGIKYSLTTNGLLLKKYAAALSQVKLSGINISLDTLDADKFSRISGQCSLKNVLSGIEAAEEAGLSPIKINIVVMKDVNENEIEDFIRFFRQKSKFHLRFIEYMSFQSEEADCSRDKGKDYFFSLAEVEEKLERKGILSPLFLARSVSGPARYYQIRNNTGEGPLIGFITPRSNPFCNQCNRLRLTSDGKLRSCLASPVTFDLKKIIRVEKDTNKIKEIFVKAVSSKPEGHHFHFCGEMIKMGG